MNDRSQVEKVSHDLIDKALSQGAAMADVTYGEYIGHSISLRDGDLEKKKSSQSMGIGLRTVDKEGRQGIASVNVIDQNSLDQLVDWSLTNCSISEPDSDVLMAEPAENLEKLDLDLWDDSVLSISNDDRMAGCIELTKKAKESDERIISIRSSSWSDGHGRSLYLNSRGILSWSYGTVVSSGVAVVVGDGDLMEIGGYSDEHRYLSDMDIDTIAKKAVHMTTRTLGGTPVPTGKYDLVLEPEISASILDFLGEMFLSSSIHKNRSLLRGKMGDMVASPLLTVVDDGLRPRGMGSSLLDSEGVPCRKTTLLEGGRVASFLYNLQYAKKDGVLSTGNGSRGIASLPDVEISNLYMRNGTTSPDEMIRSVDRGILVTDLMGLHTVNTITGDFSLGAKGIAIDMGGMTHPVAGITVAGNFMDLLKNITSVGDDLKFFGSVGACSMVIKDVAVAGV